MKSDTFKAKPSKSNKIYLNCEAQNEVRKLSEEIGTLCRRHFGSSMERLIGFEIFLFIMFLRVWMLLCVSQQIWLTKEERRDILMTCSGFSIAHLMANLWFIDATSRSFVAEGAEANISLLEYSLTSIVSVQFLTRRSISSHFVQERRPSAL